jgi:hypothetical protein
MQAPLFESLESETDAWPLKPFLRLREHPSAREKKQETQRDKAATRRN